MFMQRSATKCPYFCSILLYTYLNVNARLHNLFLKIFIVIYFQSLAFNLILRFKNVLDICIKNLTYKIYHLVSFYKVSHFFPFSLLKHQRGFRNIVRFKAEWMPARSQWRPRETQVIKARGALPLWGMDVCATFQSRLTNICWDISAGTRAMDWHTVTFTLNLITGLRRSAWMTILTFIDHCRTKKFRKFDFCMLGDNILSTIYAYI